MFSLLFLVLRSLLWRRSLSKRETTCDIAVAVSVTTEQTIEQSRIMDMKDLQSSFHLCKHHPIPILSFVVLVTVPTTLELNLRLECLLMEYTRSAARIGDSKSSLSLKERLRVNQHPFI